MKFGINSFNWEFPFATEHLALVDRAAALGFDVFEFAIADPRLIDPVALRRRLADQGLAAAACGFLLPDQDVSSEDDGIRARGLHHLRHCIDLAAAAGAPALNGPLFCAVGQTGYRTPAARREQWSRAADSLRIAANHAAAADIRLGLEPLNRYETDMLNTTAQAAEFLELVGHDAVGLMLDTYHMNIEERDTPAAIRRAGDRLLLLQGCGNDRGAPSANAVDWPGIRAALSRIGYDGPIVIEAFNPDNRRMAETFPLWRRVAPDQDSLARDGLAFLRGAFG